MKNWIVQGFIYAAFMSFMMDVGFPLMSEKAINPKRLFVGFIVWTVVGLGFSYYNHKKGKKGPNKQIDS